MHLNRLLRARRGSVAVEFAVITAFLLLPLFGAGADFVELLSAQAQLNTTLQSLYFLAYTESTSSLNDAPGVVAAINQYALHKVTYVSGQVKYDCVDTSNNVTAALSTTQPTCTGTAQLQTFVSFSLSSSVGLTLPVPSVTDSSLKFKNPFPLSASGTVQVAATTS